MLQIYLIFYTTFVAELLNLVILETIIIKEIYTDPRLIENIANVSFLSRPKIAHILKYNVINVRQLSLISGASPYTIRTLLKEKYLTKCTPIMCFDDKPETVFILRDSFFDNYITKRIAKESEL